MEDWVEQVNQFCQGPSAKTPAFTLDEIWSECATASRVGRRDCPFGDFRTELTFCSGTAGKDFDTGK